MPRRLQRGVTVGDGPDSLGVHVHAGRLCGCVDGVCVGRGVQGVCGWCVCVVRLCALLGVYVCKVFAVYVCVAWCTSAPCAW